MRLTFLTQLLLLALFSSYGCATAKNKQDPFEPINRKIFTFNQSVDKIAIKPVAKLYVKRTPTFIKLGVTNFFDNLGMVSTTLNDALQLKPSKFRSDITRLGVNTILGFGGLIDFATHFGIPHNDEDFGQTLGYWGLGSGPYLMLPLLGPSSIRDSTGLVMDIGTGPMNTSVDDNTLQAGLTTLRIINKRASLFATEAMLLQQFDPYSFLRDTYLEKRRKKVNDGETDFNTYSEKFEPEKSLLELEAEDLDLSEAQLKNKRHPNSNDCFCFNNFNNAKSSNGDLTLY